MRAYVSKLKREVQGTLPQANPAAPCTIHNVRSLQQSTSAQPRHRSRVKQCAHLEERTDHYDTERAAKGSVRGS